MRETTSGAGYVPFCRGGAAIQSAAKISPTFSWVNGSDSDGPLLAAAVDGNKDVDASVTSRFGCSSEFAVEVAGDACKDLVDGE